jgi:TPR repeat protein
VSYGEAAELFRTAEAEGEAAGTFNLGWLAEKGAIEGGKVRAVEYYRRAIEGGFVPAMNNLGVLLLSTAEGRDEGLELIRRAAAENDPYAMTNLAVAIETGQCAGDLAAVPGLYGQAARQGVPQAIVNYAEVVDGGLAIERCDQSEAIARWSTFS